MTGNQAMVSPEIFQKGQKIYSWLFEGVKQLYENYEKEGGVAARPTTAEVITTRKRRTRR
jgi:hypothetical protein